MKVAPALVTVVKDVIVLSCQQNLGEYGCYANYLVQNNVRFPVFTVGDLSIWEKNPQFKASRISLCLIIDIEANKHNIMVTVVLHSN